MIISLLLQNLKRLIFLCALQVLVLKGMVLFNLGFCFIYIIPLLLLPLVFSVNTTLLISFVVGIIIDMFYNTTGLHAFASVFVVYIRTWVFKFITGDASGQKTTVSLQSIGSNFYFTYLGTLISLHHILLFSFESLGFDTLLWLIGKIILSSILTFLASVIYTLYWSK